MYVERLLADGELLFAEFGPGQIPCVYIGGGTPSVLGAAGIKRLLGGLSALMSGAEEGPREFTVEANPESADKAFLEACLGGGVNRLSLGLQTFHEPSRRAVHRTGDGRLLPERLALASELFGENFSADLMAGLPFQDEKILSEDMEKLLAFRPGHVSLYSLTVEPGTPLAAAARSRGVSPAVLLPGADEADRLWIAGRDFLEKAGYGQYEVSSFSLPGKRSAHNIRYWRMENWLGLGPAASGTIIDDGSGRGRRYTVNPGLDAWIDRPADAPPPLGEETLEPETLMKESLLMGFRYTGGPDPALFERRFAVTVEDAIPQTLARWRGRGLAEKGRTALNREGLLLLNSFLLESFGELESPSARRGKT
jgi:oxygen-independent coproporphyrinogen-3 oxidase